jgi:ferric-dicitrate binding protein FerR (iron transport regulator)
VVHDTAHAFQVHAFGTITEDLGTAFSVRAMASDSVVHVVVAEGSASVRLADAPVSEGAVLKARDAISLDARSFRAQVRREVEVDALLSWRTGRLEFTDAPLTEVALELQRWYGVTMRFDDERLRTRRVSYNMPTNDLADVVSVLRNWVDVVQSGDTLIVK